MSFSGQVKNEVAQIIPERSCCLRAELAGLARASGSIQLGRHASLVIKTENPSIARVVINLSKRLGWERTVLVRKYTRPRHYHLFVVQLPLEQNGSNLLRELGFVDRRNKLKERLDSRILHRSCCRRSFLRGCFLGSGFISKPEHSYHLEFILNTREASEEVSAILAHFKLVPGRRERKGSYIIYLKDAEQVSEFLRIIGANHALLEFENSRIIKDMRNQVNRLVNCETANLGKSVEAGLKQVELIKEIEVTSGLSALPPPLRELAELRLRYPEASLKELGRLLSPPLTKSGVNYRFRELRRLASNLKVKKNS